jgi:hypothetical protein
MSKPKFTRDGWHVEGRSVCIGDTVYVPAMWCKDKTEEECKANANLIAAAPEMYEFIDLVKMTTDNVSLYNEADKLLRKARGENEVTK